MVVSLATGKGRNATVIGGYDRPTSGLCIPQGNPPEEDKSRRADQIPRSSWRRQGRGCVAGPLGKSLCTIETAGAGCCSITS
jgi:hypothetical protein